MLVFAREPAPGRVKTRLIPALGAAGAAALHAALAERTVRVATEAAPGGVELWCTPDGDHPGLRALAIRHGLATADQGDGDLGARMARALARATAGGETAVLVGTDCPVLTPDYVRRAIGELHASADAVIGPADDGGYVLIGLRRGVPGLFDGIAWGEADVFERQCRRFEAAGLRWTALPVLWDVDRPADLARYEALVAQRGTRSAEHARQ